MVIDVLLSIEELRRRGTYVRLVIVAKPPLKQGSDISCWCYVWLLALLLTFCQQIAHILPIFPSSHRGHRTYIHSFSPKRKALPRIACREAVPATLLHLFRAEAWIVPEYEPYFHEHNEGLGHHQRTVDPR